MQGSVAIFEKVDGELVSFVAKSAAPVMAKAVVVRSSGLLDGERVRRVKVIRLDGMELMTEQPCSEPAGKKGKR